MSIEDYIWRGNCGRRVNDTKKDFKPKMLTTQEAELKTDGKPRSRGFVFKYFENIKKQNSLPDLPFHKLRTTYTTILAKNDFSMKAISVLLGHPSEMITFENYTDKNEIICDYLEDLEPFIESVIPQKSEKNIVDCTEI